MIGYTPAEQAIRAARDEPPDTGADDPDTSHDHPDNRDFSLQRLHEGIAGAQPEARPAA